MTAMHCNLCRLVLSLRSPTSNDTDVGLRSSAPTYVTNFSIKYGHA